jgi:DNA-binding transcriptional LysR family regulator
METLANLESFVRSAETGSFSTTAQRLSLTPAAVSRNVAMLERNLGVRLFHRSTRKLTLTEAGERFLHAIRDNLEELQASIASVATDRGEPTGVLKVSMGLTFGVDYIVPLLPEFLRRYPKVHPDWHFESRQVDLIAEGLDSNRGGHRTGARCCIAHARAFAHHCRRLAGLSKRPEAAIRSVRACRV